MKHSFKNDWGGVCILAVGDLYQLPPVGQLPVYMHHNELIRHFGSTAMGRVYTA